MDNLLLRNKGSYILSSGQVAQLIKLNLACN